MPRAAIEPDHTATRRVVDVAQRHCRCTPALLQRGFTMIELMVVITIIAISAGLISLTLPDGMQRRLDEDAARLASLLESARAQSRTSGIVARWEPVAAIDGAPSSFKFSGLVLKDQMPTRWLSEGVSAEIIGAKSLVLGPEPMIGAQRVVLQFENRRAVVASDGLGPFVVTPEDTP